MSPLQNNYLNIVISLKEKIRQARTRAAISVNAELLKLYWEIGNTIIEQQTKEGWGAKIIDKLSADLKMEFPDFKGLSVRNLKYMRAFAEAYPSFGTIVQQAAAQIQNTDNQSNEIVQASLAQLEKTNPVKFVQGTLAQLSWYHHTTLLDKVKDSEIRLFYIQETIKNRWTRDIMVHQIEGNLHERQGKAINNFKTTLPAPHSDLAIETLKSPFLFDFLAMGEQFHERDLEKSLIKHLKAFMLELGKGFAYVGNQKNINVNGDDYFLDLLFYNYHLHCFVVFELKVGEFKPEYAGKLNFYVNTINAQLKGEKDAPTIGVLLCKTPNETVVKYALTGIQSPIGVADYKLAKALPKNLKGEIPTVEEFEAEIEKEIKELQKPVDKKYDRLKELISGLKQPKVQEKRNPESCKTIFTIVFLPLRDLLLNSLEEISKEFNKLELQIIIDSTHLNTDDEILAYVQRTGEPYQTTLSIYLRGFKHLGTKAFDIWKDVQMEMNNYNYTIGFKIPYPSTLFLDKLYHELPTKHEIQNVAEKITESILDDITQQVERIQSETI